MASMGNVLGLIFANMHEENLPELTKARAMASVPFGARYRLVDFPLSSMVNSGITQVGIITQAKYYSLMDHLGMGSEWDLARKTGGLHILPPYGRSDNGVYRGRLEALAGAAEFIHESGAEYVIMSDSNVVANIDFKPIIEFHEKKGADINCFTTIGNGMSSFTAQNIGANKPERIKQGFRSVLIFSLATALVFFLLFFLLNQPLLSLFMNEDGSQLAMDTGVNFLRIVAPFYFIVCLKLLCDGVLRGSESMGCFMAATFTALILRVVLAALLSNAMNDVTGIWYSWPGAWVVATVMSVIFYKSGIWTKKLISLTPEAEKEEIAEEELVDEILEEHVDMTPDK